MHRGEVWWANLHRKPRPVVLVARQRTINVRSMIIIAEVTTRVRGLQTEVPLGAEEGLPRRCVVNTDNLQTVAKTLLERRYGRLSRAKMDAVDAALRFSLGLD
jgi:mRNA interferase MazF